MGRFRNGVANWLIPEIAPWLDYIETGKPPLQEAVARVKGEHLSGIVELSKRLNGPRRLDDEDRRALHILTNYEAYLQITSWIAHDLARERADEDLHGMLRNEMAIAGASEVTIDCMTLVFFRQFKCGNSPNSAGRYVLALSDQQLVAAAREYDYDRHIRYVDGKPAFFGLVEFLFQFAPKRLDLIAPILFDPAHLEREICTLMLRKGADRFEDAIAASWRRMTEPYTKFFVAQRLLAHRPARFRVEVLEACRSIVAETEKGLNSTILEWMVETYGEEVLGDVCTCLEHGQREDPWSASRLLEATVKKLGAKAVPAVQVALKGEHHHLRNEALSHLIRLDDGTHADVIRDTLVQGIEEAQQPLPGTRSWKPLIDMIKLSEGWQPEQLLEILWPLSGHNAKLVRDAAARTLARIGEPIVPRALPLLQDPKTDRRGWAALLLSSAHTDSALRAMEARLDAETNEDIRDIMVEALDESRTASGRAMTRSEMEVRVTRASKAIKGNLASWLDESRLPPLRDHDGAEFGMETTRYLLYRQSRVKELRPDVEARPLFSMIGRDSGADFALALIQQFASSEAEASGRWAITVACLLGDDRIVPVLGALIPRWVDDTRMMMAEFGIEGLARLGTDAALATIDALALRYEPKKKRVATAASNAFLAAAERQGLTADELGDRIVPWLGFTPGQPRIVDCGGKPFKVEIGPEWNLSYRDMTKDRAVASLPRSLPKEIQAEFKGLAAMLKLVVKGQKSRIENLMLRQHRWPVDRWRELFLEHPLLFPFAVRLIWAAYDADRRLVDTFRALEDRSLTTSGDQNFEPGAAASIGIIHPLELDDSARSAWIKHLTDYEINPPFPQLDRAVIRVREDQLAQTSSGEFARSRMTVMAFRNRAEKLGWARDAGCEGGVFDAYRKVFPGSGVVAYLELDGMHYGAAMDEEITLGRFCFRHRADRRASPASTVPAAPAPDSLIPFGEVSPVVFSEVMGDLARISGQAGEVSGED